MPETEEPGISQQEVECNGKQGKDCKDDEDVGIVDADNLRVEDQDNQQYNP